MKMNWKTETKKLTPSTASTTKTRPSDNLTLAVVSSEKFTCPKNKHKKISIFNSFLSVSSFHFCFSLSLFNYLFLPGASNIFKTYDLSFKFCITRVIGIVFIESPRCCSSTLESVKWIYRF